MRIKLIVGSPSAFAHPVAPPLQEICHNAPPGFTSTMNRRAGMRAAVRNEEQGGGFA